MADDIVVSWQTFFRLVGAVFRECEMKIGTDSPQVIEALLDKIEHCTRGVMRILDVVNTAVEENNTCEIEHLQTTLESLLGCLQNEHTTWADKQLHALRTNNFSPIISSTTTNHSNSRGRPCISLNMDQVMILRSLHFKWNSIAKLLGVSRSTLYRKCKEAGYVDTLQTDVSDEDLQLLVSELKLRFPDAGERMLSGFIRARGIHVSRDKLRCAIHAVDPINTALRWNAKIQRRTYSVPGPNSLWHIDGNHKLIRWRLVIHGGVDGYSRLIVYLHCSNNNLAATVLQLFQEATTYYFIPSRVRCDRGVENFDVARFMLQARGFDRGSVITGSSVHNQRIERLWRDVFRCVTVEYYKLFYAMESVGLLDHLNEFHLFALHWTFLPRINRALNEFQAGWNQHAISGQKQSSPLQLFTTGIARLQAGGRIAEDFFISVEESYGIDYDGPVPAADRGNTDCDIVVPSIDVSLPEEVHESLSSVNVLRDSDNLGVDIYDEVVQILMAMHND